MGKFYGDIGFVQTVNDGTGKWLETITRRQYAGDILKIYGYNKEDNSKQNTNIDISNQISVIADAYIYENFQFMKFVEWMGALWNITSIEVQRPRVILSIGGVYNGPAN